jgi:hypothetical protein
MGCILSVLLVAAQAERETIKQALPELNKDNRISLFVPERHHGIYSRRSSRRHITRRHRHYHQNQ